MKINRQNEKTTKLRLGDAFCVIVLSLRRFVDFPFL